MTNVFNQYVDPSQVSDALLDPLPELSDVVYLTWIIVWSPGLASKMLVRKS